MPLARNSAGLYATPSIKNLAGLVPGIGMGSHTWNARLSRSVMYAPKNTTGWTFDMFMNKSTAPRKMPKMGHL